MFNENYPSTKCLRCQKVVNRTVHYAFLKFTPSFEGSSRQFKKLIFRICSKCYEEDKELKKYV